MQILILLPLLVHLWLLRKQRNRLLLEGAASLIVFSVLLYTGDRRLYAAFLLLIFILDTGGAVYPAYHRTRFYPTDLAAFVCPLCLDTDGACARYSMIS